jgi:hypothetical protein
VTPVLTLRPAPPWPTLVADLERPEGFVVRSLRRWVQGLRANDATHWRLVWHAFEGEMGESDGRAALADFARLVTAVQGHARRPLAPMPPCFPVVVGDEACLVDLVAACQAGRFRLARERAARLVTDDRADMVVEAAGRLAAAMDRHALRLAVRSSLAANGDGINVGGELRRGGSHERQADRKLPVRGGDL